MRKGNEQKRKKLDEEDGEKNVNYSNPNPDYFSLKKKICL